MSSTPVILFAHARPELLRLVLDGLRTNGVTRIIAYLDGPRTEAEAVKVRACADLLESASWADVRLNRRATNAGLGASILAGVTEVSRTEPRFIVWEDDLIPAPGCYAWLCAALAAYETDARVGSVTGWTHPRVTPAGLRGSPYFDPRAECWVWGSWARAWQGMPERNAEERLEALRAMGRTPDRIGHDLRVQAGWEKSRNLWAARWLLHHLESDLLCLRPPRTLVTDRGSGVGATNNQGDHFWDQPEAQPAPPPPDTWPAAVEHPRCAALWRNAYPGRLGRAVRSLQRVLLRILTR